MYLCMCVYVEREREKREDESSDTIVKLANLLHIYSLSGTHISKCHHYIHTFMLAKKKKRKQGQELSYPYTLTN